ncbi:MAG: hypothetical protein J0I82_29100 [Spirosoma sp.]|nr:hypothetical protein [Spirosoma sp.]OJW74646.1 MAG: hypothetical protein BGO59_20415 [Spirosoma sp. 48-14]
MEDFTPTQLLAITRGYCDMARALNEYQVHHWPELSHEQQLDLNAYQNSLLNRSQDLQSHTVRPAFTNAIDVATQILEATTEAQTSLTRIGDPVVALNVGAITVALAAYVARANLRGIQTALRELEDLVK